MSITSRTALLGFSLALAALTAPAAGQAAVQPTSVTGSIEQRLQRIGAAFRAQGDLSGADGVSAGDQRLAYGFANAGRGGFANAARGGFVNGGALRGGAFRNW